MKCTCCERTKIGVPCSCFFRIARDANIPYDKIMDVGMFDVRYTKLFNSHYASEDKTMANMIYEAQKVCTQAITNVYIWFSFTSVFCLRLFPIYIRFKISIPLHPNHIYIHFSVYIHLLFTSNSTFISIYIQIPFTSICNTKILVGLLRHGGSWNRGDGSIP